MIYPINEPKNTQNIDINEDIFFSPYDLASHIGLVKINLKSRQAILRIFPYGNHFFSNFSSNYSSNVKILEKNFEVIIDFKYQELSRYIAKQRENHASVLSLTLDIIKKHKIVIGNTYQKIDREQFLLSIETEKEKIKIEKYYETIREGKKPSIPRLKILKLENKKAILRDAWNLVRFKEEPGLTLFKYLDLYVEKIEASHEIHCNGFSNNGLKRLPTLQELEKMESLGAVFAKDGCYEKIKKTAIFNTLGGENE